MAGWQKKGTTTAQLMAGTDHIFVPYEFVQEEHPEKNHPKHNY